MIATHCDLQELLVESAASAAERERTEFDRLTHPYTNTLVLFGAGGMGLRVRQEMAAAGVEVVAMTDNNSALWGQSLNGCPILSPQTAASRFGCSATFVVCVWGVKSRDRMAAHIRQLRHLGCQIVVPFVPLFWKFADRFLPYHVIDLPSKALADAALMEKAFALWSDDASRSEYLAQLNWRLRGDFDSMADPVREPIYFIPEVFSPRTDACFVDCGAYDGDTVQQFLKQNGPVFRQLVALEPDPGNFARLRRVFNTLPPEVAEHIQIHQKAASIASGKLRFCALGTDGSAFGDGGIEVACVRLDDILDESCPPTFIKLDIEGAELDAIEGARSSIARHRPALAVCAYHRQSDLWRIPLLIHNIRADYRYYLRPHLLEGWDVVCYTS